MILDFLKYFFLDQAEKTKFLTNTNIFGQDVSSKTVLDKTLKGIRGVRLENRKLFSYTRS